MLMQKVKNRIREIMNKYQVDNTNKSSTDMLNSNNNDYNNSSSIHYNREVFNHSVLGSLKLRKFNP